MFDQREWCSRNLSVVNNVLIQWKKFVISCMLRQAYFYKVLTQEGWSIISNAACCWAINAGMQREYLHVSMNHINPFVDPLQTCEKKKKKTARWQSERFIAAPFSPSSDPCSHTMATMADSVPLDKKIPGVETWIPVRLSPVTRQWPALFSTFGTHMPEYLIPAHTNTRRLYDATRNLTRIQHKGLVQKYFISQEEMLFQGSVLAELCGF